MRGLERNGGRRHFRQRLASSPVAPEAREACERVTRVWRTRCGASHTEHENEGALAKKGKNEVETVTQAPAALSAVAAVVAGV